MLELCRKEILTGLCAAILLRGHKANSGAGRCCALPFCAVRCHLLLPGLPSPHVFSGPIPMCGSLLFVPQHLNFVRIVVALLLSICYLTILMAARPYKRLSTAFVAIFTNLSLCLTLLAALLVKVIDQDFASLADDDVRSGVASFGVSKSTYFGFNSAFPLTVIILIVNFGVLLAVLCFVGQQSYEESRAPVTDAAILEPRQTAALRGTSPHAPYLKHTAFHLVWQVLRIKETGLRPILTLAAGIYWALFLSHQWSNQYVCATIKRQLQLLLPGVRVFIDVEDLKSVDALEEYVKASAVVLIMLGSPRYFHSKNCLTEVTTSQRQSKPLCLVHDSDLDNNGAPLDVLKASCPADLRGFLFNARSVLPWHRLYDFRALHRSRPLSREICSPHPPPSSSSHHRLIIVSYSSHHLPRDASHSPLSIQRLSTRCPVLSCVVRCGRMPALIGPQSVQVPEASPSTFCHFLVRMRKSLVRRAGHNGLDRPYVAAAHPCLSRARFAAAAASGGHPLLAAELRI